MRPNLSALNGLLAILWAPLLFLWIKLGLPAGSSYLYTVALRVPRFEQGTEQKNDGFTLAINYSVTVR